MKILTKQEELILLAIFQIKENPCLLGIWEILVRDTGKDWALASLYLSLENLRKKGLVLARRGQPSLKRGGRAVTFYRITPPGIETLAETKKIQDRMWKGFLEFAASGGKR
jgi:PadR family transcriptional regulator PadR